MERISNGCNRIIRTDKIYVTKFIVTTYFSFTDKTRINIEIIPQLGDFAMTLGGWFIQNSENIYKNILESIN